MKPLLAITSIAYISLAALAVQAQPSKRLYIANDDHTDYMWTANEADYDSAFVHMLDYYLNQTDSTLTNAPDFQSRFNCDGSMWLQAYEKYRSPQQFNRLIARIKSGHISSPLNLLVSCYGAQPAEAVLRGMYYAGSLERKYDLRFPLVAAMENNTIPLGLASLWAGSGAKYSWRGIGGYGSQLSYEARTKRTLNLYQYTGLDSASILTKAYTYDEKKYAPLGGYAECRMVIKYNDLEKDMDNLVNKLDAFIDSGKTDAHYPYRVAGAFGFGWDDLETYVAKPFVHAAQRGTNAQRKVRVSNEIDFFKDVETTYPKLPAEAVSYGNEWDTYCASMNETTASVRRSVEKLRTAEAMAALASLRDDKLLPPLKDLRNTAWESLGMYWEHDWTADGPVGVKARAAWQIKLQQQLAQYVDTLYQVSQRSLARQVAGNKGSTIAVFNPLGWQRSDVATIEYSGNTLVQITDATTGKMVPVQFVKRAGKQYLQFMAGDVPATGYKLYEISPSASTANHQTTSVLAKGEYISNKFYRIRLSPTGAITEWYDSLAGSRQLVKDIEGRYINDLGYFNTRHGSKVVVENAGPVSATLKAYSNYPVPHVTRLTLYANSKRIDLEDSILANFGDVKTWSFLFNINQPTTHHEEVGAILTAKKQANGGHYANSIARYDWLTFNHFANVGNSVYNITLSNLECSFFKLGRSTVDSLWEQSSQINALAGGQVDAKVEDQGMLGVPNQNGNNRFAYHFALTSQPSTFDAVASMQFAMEHQNPLATFFVTGEDAAYKQSSFSMGGIDTTGVLLWSLKPAEDGADKGWIMRYWNMNGQAVQPQLNLWRPIQQAWKTSHIETDESMLKPVKGSAPLSFKPFQLNTYRVVLNLKK